MREIKFRAWNGKEMYYNPILWDGLVFRDTKDFMNGVDVTDQVMQFTGIRDKNSKEIYECDFLKDAEGNLYLADFIKGCFFLKTKYSDEEKERLKEYRDIKDGFEEYLPMSEMDRLAVPAEFEVIGNLYESIKQGVNHE